MGDTSSVKVGAKSYSPYNKHQLGDEELEAITTALQASYPRVLSSAPMSIEEELIQRFSPLGGIYIGLCGTWCAFKPIKGSKPERETCGVTLLCFVDLAANQIS